MTNPAPELGTTVEDARRLARKAARVFIHFNVGPEIWKTDCISLTRRAFVEAIKCRVASDAMPCKLYQPDSHDELWLQIGT